MAEALGSAGRGGVAQQLAGCTSGEGPSAALNKLGPTGVNVLHLAVWRNHLGLSEALLAAGADPSETPDAESGWSCLHHALYWGNLRVAALLLQHDASLGTPDWRGRTPLDLLSRELQQYLAAGQGEVYGWGNGANYTLGNCATSVQLNPSRVERLHNTQVVLLCAAKFHSAAVTEEGQLYTWGWGRGGRLGHPESHIHSGESAVIAPRLVAALGRRQVAAVSAAKHHTVLCTTAGEVFTCGSNRYGQLGYAVDTQPTPRRVAALRQRVVAVAAANKHSVAVTSAGEVFTWGTNVLGQLGYGTFESASNATPRLVEAMRGKVVTGAAAAKRHTLVMTRGGDVFTWGHRGVSPRRVQLAGVRDTLSAGGEPLRFHRGHADVARPHAAAVCAGAAHSGVLTTTGVLLAWRSADPALVVHEVGAPLAGKRVVAVSAGKYRMAAVTDEGDTFMWEGRSDYFPAEGRQGGSGSKKHGAPKARPIPAGRGGTPEAAHHGSVGRNGSVEVGSYGSLSRKGSFFERFARERESGSYGSYGAAPDTPGSASKQPADVPEQIVPVRVEGLKRAVQVAVGEKHSLALQRWSAVQLEGLPSMPWLQSTAAPPPDLGSQHSDDGQLLTPRSELGSEGSAGDLLMSPGQLSPSRMQLLSSREEGVESLQRICEREVARTLVDPRACLQVLEYADVAGADLLRAYCLSVAVCNLDAVLLEARGAYEELPPHLLAELEQLWKLRLDRAPGSTPPQHTAAAEEQQGTAPEPAGPADSTAAEPAVQPGSRLQARRRPTSARPLLADGAGLLPGAGSHGSAPNPALLGAGESSFRDKAAQAVEEAAQRLLRTLQKKLQQIAHLEERVSVGAMLDPQQQAKLQQKPVMLSAVAALEGGMPAEEVQGLLHAASAADDPLLLPQPGGSSGKEGSTPASSASGKKPKKGRRGSSKPASDASEAPVVPALNITAAAGGHLGSSPPELGSSPPASSLVPAFGAAGPAAAEPEPSPTRHVGFASSSSGWGARLPEQPPSAGRVKESRGKSRKGALSLFLRGELEAQPSRGLPTPLVPPASGASPGPAASGPAWGGKQPGAPAAAATSLKDIQQQEAAASSSGVAAAPKSAPSAAPRGNMASGGKARPAGEASEAVAAATRRLSLASLMPPAYQPIQQPAASKAPAWRGASPPSSQLSLREIQEEQERHLTAAAAAAARARGSSPPPVGPRAAAGLPAWRPPVAPAGGAPPLMLGSSPTASAGLFGTSPSGRSDGGFTAAPVLRESKWYLPDGARGTGKSLRAIQTEESAIKDFTRRFGDGNVRLVPSSGAPRQQGQQQQQEHST